MGTLRTQRTIQLPELPRSSAQMNDLIKWAGDISRVLDRMNRQMRSDLDEMIMGSVSVDHGGLSGLSDDDHTQYHNNTRGDARYSLLAHNHDSTYATLAHTHASYVTGPSSATGHSVALFDGVTGKLLHDSIGVTARIGDHAFNSDHNIELNAYAASDSYCYVDFIAKVGSDYNSRFIRNGGENGTLDIIQTGTGHTNFSGSVVHFEDTTEATSASAASMVLDGGIGIAKKMYIAGQIVSTLAVGTKPLDVTSTTLCDNLNADLLDGNHASAFAVTAHTHTTIANALTISDTTESSSYTTGALIVSGGIGIAKKAYFNSTVNVAGVATLASTTDSSSTTTGGTIISGGLGVAKKLYIGSNVNASMTMTDAGGSHLVVGTTAATTVGGSNSQYASQTVLYPKISAGVTNSGILKGHNVVSRRNAISGDEGTLGSLKCLHLQYGHLNSAAVSPVTTNIYGIHIEPYIQTGTITTQYDIFISSPATGGTLTTHYSIYQQSTTALNYCAGISTFANTTDASSSTTGGLIVSGGIGIAKKTYHGDTTEASSVSAASVVLAGGIGIAKKMYIAGQIVSTLAVGTKPIDVTSTTLCTNLNADLIDGYHASEFSTYLHTHNLLYLSIPVFSSANMLAKTVTTHTTMLSICKMDETKIALLYNDSYGKRRLACYEYSSGSWDIVGSYYTINASSICRLTDDRVVVFRTTSYDIECYEFDGSTWSKKGNSYSGSANTRGCAFGDNSIVTVCGTYIRILSFDGTDFSQVGNTYTYSGHSLTHCTATSGTTICVTEHLTFGSDSIGMYEFDGSDWAKVGNSFSTSAIYSVTCLNEAIIALIDFDSELKTYRFNGTDFSHESTLVNFTAGDFPVITSLNGVDIASASTFEAAICYFRFCTIEETSFSMSDITSNDVSTSKHGFCPKLPNDATKYLDGTGAWAQVTDADLSTSDVTTNNASTSKHGFCPKLPNDATKYLDGTGAWEKVTDADLSLSDVSTNNVGTSAHGFAPKAPNDATKFLDGTGAWDTVKDSDIAGTAWTSYVPSLTNITLGTGGTATGYYKRIGKTVHFWAIITFGSSTMAIGGWAAIGLPTAASSSYSSTTPIGVGWMSDASSGKNYPLLIKYDGFIFCYVHGSTYTTLGFVTTGAPFTVANTDTICVSGSYQID